MSATNVVSLRERCPVSRAFVESFERAFGADQVRVVAISEGDVELGRFSSGTEAQAWLLSDYTAGRSPFADVRELRGAK